jgi:hypothetical protein
MLPAEQAEQVWHDRLTAPRHRPTRPAHAIGSHQHRQAVELITVDAERCHRTKTPSVASAGHYLQAFRCQGIRWILLPAS